MITRTLRLAACLAALGVVASACSDDGADADTASTTTPAPVAATMAPAATDAPMTTPAPATTDADIVDTAIAAGDFTTLVAAVQAAGLEDTLRGEGPFTVFAPTDAAFAKLPPGTVESLLKPENKEKLRAILTYHVVPGTVRAAQVVNLTEAKTVNGQSVRIKADQNGVMVGGAKVIKTDIEASNGVIHVIDTVLLPN